MRRSLATGLTLLAAVGRPALALEPPAVYGSLCPAAGEPMRVTLTDTPKGPMVRLEQPGETAVETADANLAHVSRRLFFTARTAAGRLVEFQGRAGREALTGTLSDDRGAARTIALPATVDPARCEAGHEVGRR